jgi:hypothetical protein
MKGKRIWLGIFTIILALAWLAKPKSFLHLCADEGIQLEYIPALSLKGNNYVYLTPARNRSNFISVLKKTGYTDLSLVSPYGYDTTFFQRHTHFLIYWFHPTAKVTYFDEKTDLKIESSDELR